MIEYYCTPDVDNRNLPRAGHDEYCTSVNRGGRETSSGRPVQCGLHGAGNLRGSVIPALKVAVCMRMRFSPAQPQLSCHDRITPALMKRYLGALRVSTWIDCGVANAYSRRLDGIPRMSGVSPCHPRISGHSSHARSGLGLACPGGRH
jgi:hypothetical protein